MGRWKPPLGRQLPRDADAGATPEKKGISVTAATEQKLENYAESFSRFEKLAAGHDVAWLQNLRRNALARFCEVGFPSTGVEDWRFTNVSAIAEARFQLARDGSSEISREQIEQCLPATRTCALVFINGRFSRQHSSVESLPAGLTISSLSGQIRQNPGSLEPHLGRYLNLQRDPFCALNTAFLEDGAYVRAAKNVVAPDPIYLLFVSIGDKDLVMSHPRNLIIAESGSEIDVVEDYMSLDGSVEFCNSATELIANENATVSHYRIERHNTRSFNTSTLRIQQARTANVASHSILIGGALVRNNVHPVLAGEGGECLINGLFIGTGRQHLDNYMLVEHAGPHCGSRQFYNGILDDKAHGVFHGRIVVHKDAQKTDAKQTNRNVLLSDDALIDTKPQLEIFADDVKCTHGATIGQIEGNAIFYLRSRGIDEVSARRLLLMAFANECLERMREGAAREHVEKLIHEHLSRIAKIGSVEKAPRGVSETLQEAQ